MDVLPRSAAHFGKNIADESEKWAKVIRAPNIKADRRHLWPGWGHQRRAIPPGAPHPNAEDASEVPHRLTWQRPLLCS
jgi:hypothetical protein